MANPITNKVKTGGIPVIKKDLEDGVIAEANNDGTIYLDKKVKNNTPLAKEAVAHEMVHMDQMARGDLDYNDDKVFWKGKEYDRDDMNEGSKNLPWEKEAYNKTKNMKKSPMKLDFSLSKGAINTNEDVIISDLQAKAGKRGALGEAIGSVAGEVAGFKAFQPKDTNPNDKKNDEDTEKPSGAGMNLKNKDKSALKMKATPITLKAKSPAKFGPLAAVAGKALIGAAANKVVDSAMKMTSPLHIETERTREFDGNNEETGEYGTFTETGKDKIEKVKKDSVNEFAEKCGTKANPKAKSYVNSEGKTIACSWADDEDFDKESEYEEKKTTIWDSAFTPDEKKSQEPGTPDKRNMGYYESMDAKWGAGVRHRGRKKVDRNLNKASKKWDRKGGIINPETGENFDTKADYLKYVGNAASGEYNIAVGKTKFGKPAGEETTSNVGKQEGKPTYKKGEDGKLICVSNCPEDETTNVATGNGAEMNSKNKNKSAFKMQGWAAYKN